MGFKIVFNKKMHKLPPQISSLEELKTTIEKLYPQLTNGYHIYYIHQSEPLEIIHNDALIILVRLLKLAVVKLLVSELNIQDLGQDDLTFIEQSSIYSQSVIQNNNKPVQQEKPQQQKVQNDEIKQAQNVYPELNLIEKQQIPPQQIQQQSIQPVVWQAPQLQGSQQQQPQYIPQIIPQQLPYTTQQIQQYYQQQIPQTQQVPVQNTSKVQNVFDQLLQPQQQQQQQQLQYQKIQQQGQQQIPVQTTTTQQINPFDYFQQPQLQPQPTQQQQVNIQKQFQYPPQDDQHLYYVELINNHQVQSFPNQEFVWKLIFKNTGYHTWPQTMTLKCIEDPYKNQKIALPEAVPSQVVEILVKLKSPSEIGTLFVNWVITYLENTQEKILPLQINMFLEVIQEVPEQRFQNTLILRKAEQVKQVIPNISINFVCKYIEKHNLLRYNVDDIINRIYDEQIKN